MRENKTVIYCRINHSNFSFPLLRGCVRIANILLYLTFQLARVIGNDNFNEILEARLTDSTLKPKPNSPM